MTDKVVEMHGNKIPEDVRKVLWLHAKGLSGRKIAEQTDASETKVRGLIGQARYLKTIEYYKKVQAQDLKKTINKEWALAKGIEMMELAEKYGDKYKFYDSVLRQQGILSDKVTEKEVPQKKTLKELEKEIQSEYSKELKKLDESAG